MRLMQNVMNLNKDEDIVQFSSRLPKWYALEQVNET
jgi:hypothetical protein